MAVDKPVLSNYTANLTLNLLHVFAIYSSYYTMQVRIIVIFEGKSCKFKY